MINAMTVPLTIATTAWSLDGQNSGPEWAEQAEIAEALNYHSFWLPESHFNGSRSLPSPLLLLAAIASRTSNIKLGTTSYLLPIRHPIVAAEEVAVLDQLCSGRLILGIGRGFQQSMFSVFGIDHRQKRKRFSAVLEQMIAAWSGQPIGEAQLEGGVVEPIYLAPLPRQNPHPPIWVAAFGPLALKQAGSLGLPYLASPMETAAVLQENYRQYREHIAASGLQPVATVPIMRTVFISEDRSKIERMRHQAQHNARASGGRQDAANLDDWALIGDPDFVIKGLQRYRKSLGMTHLIVSGRLAGMEAEDYLQSLQLLAQINVELGK